MTDSYQLPEFYERQAHVMRVVDGDTLHLLVDLGCDIQLAMAVRLLGLNAPEKNTEEGKVAKLFVEAWVRDYGPWFIVRTQKDKREKYGRYLADLLPLDGGDSLCTRLLNSNQAKPYFGGAR